MQKTSGTSQMVNNSPPSKPMPPELSALVATTLDAMRKRDDHHILPIERDRIYQSFRDKNGKVDWRLASWLSLKAAQKVLPILRRGWGKTPVLDSNYEYPAPEQILDIAEAVLRGKESINDKPFKSAIEFAYTSSGNFWESFPYNAYCAGEAIYNTLCAINHGDPFRQLRMENGAFWRVAILQKANSTEAKLWEIIDDEPTQLHLHESVCDESFNGLGDAAASACCAWSVFPQKGEWPRPYDFDKRCEFWEWWLTEAIPEVWAIVSAAT